MNKKYTIENKLLKINTLPANFSSAIAISLIFCLFQHLTINAQQNDLRLDKFDVIHYHIGMDFMNTASQQISGRTKLSIQPQSQMDNSIALDFAGLTVDTVYSNYSACTYLHRNDTLHIRLISIPKDTFSIWVKYHGKPQLDPSGFGGLVLNGPGGYSYNMGAAINSIPHTFGKTWFPCIDNFLDKASYSFEITTKANEKAICNGSLTDSSFSSDKTYRTWKWNFDQQIVPYLANVAVGKYAFIYQDISTNARKIPLILAARPQDSSTAITSFANLTDAVNIYDSFYYPYPFGRLGYVSVPENAGAMEHAGNISFPELAFNGTLNNTLMAHELSHQWWGNLVTCSSAEDMWLNEGWASYSEDLFQEKFLGLDDERAYFMYNHFQVLEYAHLLDSGYRAISPMDQKYTYGRHVYLKGASAVRTLRSYLGDVAFFQACHNYLKQYSYKSANSHDLQSSFERSSGKKLGGFFKHWILEPGFTHLYFQTLQYNATSQILTFSIGQSLKKAMSLYDSIPLIVRIFDSRHKAFDFNFFYTIDNPDYFISTASLGVDSVTMVLLNPDERIADASVKNYSYVSRSSSVSLSLTHFKMNVAKTSDDSTLLAVTHHCIGPNNQIIGKNIRISSERYWTIDWPTNSNLDASATFQYDGRTSADISIGHLDNELITMTEDSLHLLYRADASSQWTEVTDLKKYPGIKTDKFGSMIAGHIKRGDYCFAQYGAFVGIEEPVKDPLANIRIYPVPSLDLLNISSSEDLRGRYSVTDILGRKMLEGNLSNNMTLDIRNLSTGNYILNCQGQNFSRSFRFIRE